MRLIQKFLVIRAEEHATRDMWLQPTFDEAKRGTRVDGLKTYAAQEMRMRRVFWMTDEGVECSLALRMEFPAAPVHLAVFGTGYVTYYAPLDLPAVLPGFPLEVSVTTSGLPGRVVLTFDFELLPRNAL
jgi:hypothetical protein